MVYKPVVVLEQVKMELPIIRMLLDLVAKMVRHTIHAAVPRLKVQELKAVNDCLQRLFYVRIRQILIFLQLRWKKTVMEAISRKSGL